MTQSALYQELIIDHATHPRHHHTLEQPTHTAQGHNPICGDKMTLYLKVENHKIIEACFQGEGCAISMASASIMSELLHDKTVSQAEALLDRFQKMLTEKEPAPINHPKLEALSGVRAYPMRVKCATLPWHALEYALQNKSDLATTES